MFPLLTGKPTCDSWCVIRNINQLEFRHCIWPLVLRCFHVLVCPDISITRVALGQIALSTLHWWAHPWLASLKEIYLLGLYNSAATTLSIVLLKNAVPREQHLHPEIVSQIQETFGKAQMDFFADAK